MYKLSLISIISMLVIMMVSCQMGEEKAQKSSKRPGNKEIKENLIRTNQYLVKAEEQNIKDFVERHAYQMQETGSGLWYEIYQQGKGESAQKDKVAEIRFTISLLSGEIIYRTEEEGIKEFLIGKGRVESGLEEGILLLKVGDRARFIIPSHLAFGLLGDLEKIPEKATIVYDLELLNLK